MKCEYCGSKLTKKQTKCPNCGAPAPASREDKLFDMMEDTMEENMKTLMDAKERAEEELNSQRKNDTGYVPNTEFNPDKYRPDTEFNPANYNSGKENKYVPKGGANVLGIVGMIFSITYVFAFVGLIIAIIDLVRKDGKKKIYSIISLIILGVWLIFTIIASFFVDDVDIVGTEAQINQVIEQVESGEVESIVTTVDDLLWELEKDGAAASEMYYGKYVEVTGYYLAGTSKEKFELHQMDNAFFYTADVDCYPEDQDMIRELKENYGTVVHCEMTMYGVVTKVSDLYGYEISVVDYQPSEAVLEKTAEKLSGDN